MHEAVPVLPRGQFYGITSGVEIGGLRLTEVYHSEAREVPLHGHEAAYFCMLLEGGYRERYGDTEVTYGPFTIAFHALGMKHTDIVGPNGARFFMIELDDRWERVVSKTVATAVPVAEFRGGEAVWAALRLYMDMRSGTLTELSAESAMYELIGALPEMHPVDDSEVPSAALSRVVAAIDDGFNESLSLANLAQRVGVHPVHLARTFRRTYNRSVGEYIHGRRIQAASRAMLETNRPLADIATECGFFDQSHFNRVFKAVTGTTPTAYRKRVSRENARHSSS